MRKSMVSIRVVLDPIDFHYWGKKYSAFCKRKKVIQKQVLNVKRVS